MTAAKKRERAAWLRVARRIDSGEFSHICFAVFDETTGALRRVMCDRIANDLGGWLTVTTMLWHEGLAWGDDDTARQSRVLYCLLQAARCAS